MTVLTEVQHTGEFIVSEGNGSISREVGTLLSGEVLKDGSLIALSAGNLVASEGNAGSETIIGISIGAHSAVGANKEGVPYIARLAEVDGSLIYVADTDGVPSAACITELAGLNIIAR